MPQYKFEFIRTDQETEEETITVIDPSESETATFIPSEEDVGKLLKVRLTVSNNFGSSVQERELGVCTSNYDQPVIVDVFYEGELNPGNIISVSETIERGKTPYSTEYQFLNSTGTVLQEFSSSPSYELKISDVGSSLEVNIRTTDDLGVVSDTINSNIGDVFVDLNLQLVDDIDSDGVVDTNDEDKIGINADVSTDRIKKKWVIKYTR
jgi:hypothetical protein|tara:strand:+ start:6369 stop:6995 length:627 start_codon:yes stop_codon:yes gene_type:complete